MFQDGNAPLHQAAAVQPRQVLSSGTYSTAIDPSRTSNVVPVTPSPLSSTSTAWTPHAAYSLVTTGIDLGDDLCTAGIPAGGIIEFNETYTIFLPDAASYVAACNNQSIFSNNVNPNETVVKANTPFYASTYPQVYTLATATVISYILVILIFITPRTFYVGGPGTGTATSSVGIRALLPGRGGRNKNVIGIGRRPLLQKIAAVSVAVSLTIACADTFDYAATQYDHGYVYSQFVVEQVIGSMEIRVTRIISDTFLWLAQVQTLIRLFPRHKEKVTIKWLGFGLVLCDTVFSCLENFVSEANRVRPDSFNDAIPALSYLFELSISLIYASCVLYFALSKRRFAFWHARMRNVCLVALLSIIAVLIPVVFFITDLAQPDIAVWGEYIRWVGAAAASVVVWEWVERIEALERDEKKDGILGREIFDGDEMLEITPSEDGDFSDPPNHSGRPSRRESSKFWKNVRDLNVDIRPRMPLRRKRKDKTSKSEENDVTVVEGGAVKSDSKQIARPPQAVTPISRSDTNSAASTVYQVRYHDPFSPSPAIPEDRVFDVRRQSMPLNVPPAISDESTLTNSTSTTVEDPQKIAGDETAQAGSTGRQIWQGVANPFKRKRTEPPAEVAAQIANSNARRSPIDAHLNLRSRFNAFTSSRKGKRGGRAQNNRTPLAITVIPAQPRASRVNIEEDAMDARLENAATHEAAAAEDSANDESDSESDVASPDLAALPVTVIPAPIRGGRTWSPDDIAGNEQVTPPTPQISPPDMRLRQQPVQAAPTSDEVSATVQSQRGALTITESPGRTRGITTATNGRNAMTRRSRNVRSGTMTSISDRMGSTSPAAMATSRSIGTDGSGVPRPTST